MDTFLQWRPEAVKRVVAGPSRYDGWVTTLAELEARVAALEAERADYRAVLAAVGALGQHVNRVATRVGAVEGRLEGVETRVGAVELKVDAAREVINAVGEKLAGFQVETRDRFTALEAKFDGLSGKIDGHTDRFRSLEESNAEIRDLLLRALER